MFQVSSGSLEKLLFSRPGPAATQLNPKIDFVLVLTSFIRLGLASYSPGIISTRRREHFHQSIHHRFRHNVPTQRRQQPYSESESCIGGIALWSDGIKENPRAATELLNIGFFVSHQAQHSSPLVSATEQHFPDTTMPHL